MKRITHNVFLLILVIGIFQNLYSQSRITTIVDSALIFGSKSNFIVVEAEHFNSQTLTGKRAWYINSPKHYPMVWPDHDRASYTDAGGFAYMEALPDLFHSEEDPIINGDNLGSDGDLAVMHYKINFQKPGRYFLWTRLRSNDQEDNTIQAGINGTWPINSKILQSPVEKKMWIWKSENRLSRKPWKIGRASLDIPSAGIHDIQFCMREDGEEFDRFILTTDSLYSISDGVGPDETIWKGKLPKPFSLKNIASVVSQPMLNPDSSFYGANVMYKDTLGMVSFEAENFYRQSKAGGRMWHLATSAITPQIGPDSDINHAQNASENAYLELLPDGRQKDEDAINSKNSICNVGGKQAILSYMVLFEKPGTYYFWVRALAVDGDDNTLHVGIDNNWSESSKKLTFQGKSWKWSNTQRDTKAKIAFEIKTKGIHEVQVSMREDGCEIDRIFITNDKNFVPNDSIILPSKIKIGNINKWYETRNERMNTNRKYLPINGIIAIEAESVPVTEGWVYKADTTKFSGLGYLEWGMTGQGIKPGKGILNYTFDISEPGNYQLFIRGKLLNPANRPETLDPDGNDIWVKFIGGNDVKNQKCLANDWFKTLIIGHPTGWTWNTNADGGKTHPLTAVCRYYEKGTYTISLCGRSEGFAIDKIILAKIKKPILKFDNKLFSGVMQSESIICVNR
jgi:hypothetical protein